MTTIISETRERLLKAIAAQVPPERIAEIHFFAPIKQGGVESGVAVVAATPEVPALVPSDDELPDAVEAESMEAEAVEAGLIDGESAEDDAVDEESIDDVVMDTSESDAAPTAVDRTADDAKRHVIYTARYRLTLKGPDRGKWEVNVVAEADAPLITVETVVRGVQRRVGDVEEPERLGGDEIRALLEPRHDRAGDGR